MAGAQRESHSSPFLGTISYFKLLSSCLASPDSLDCPCRRRSAAHTDILVGMHDEETLRKKYGIAPGATVHFFVAWMYRR